MHLASSTSCVPLLSDESSSLHSLGDARWGENLRHRRSSEQRMRRSGLAAIYVCGSNALARSRHRKKLTVLSPWGVSTPASLKRLAARPKARRPYQRGVPSVESRQRSEHLAAALHRRRHEVPGVFEGVDASRKAAVPLNLKSVDSA